MRKNNDRKKSGEEKKSGGFVVLLTSLSVILLAFFILLNTMATVDQERVRKALGSLISGFGIMPGGFSLDNLVGNMFFSTPFGVEKKGFKDTLDDLERAALKLGTEDDMSLQKSNSGIVITLADRIMFSSGAVEVNPKIYKILDQIALLIKRCKNDVRIEGHTDNIPVNQGRYSSNWMISSLRAVNVLKYFVEKGKISPDRLSAEGFGEYHPVALNDTDENRAKNRRVNIVFQGRIEEVENGKERKGRR